MCPFAHACTKVQLASTYTPVDDSPFLHTYTYITHIQTDMTQTKHKHIYMLMKCGSIDRLTVSGIFVVDHALNGSALNRLNLKCMNTASLSARPCAPPGLPSRQPTSRPCQWRSAHTLQWWEPSQPQLCPTWPPGGGETRHRRPRSPCRTCYKSARVLLLKGFELYILHEVGPFFNTSLKQAENLSTF